MRFVGQSLASAMLLGISGCAIYSPFDMKRYGFDWNSERHLNAQVEMFDHLPPKPLRVKLMRWGYNIGPSGDCPVPAPGGWQGRVFSAPGRNGPRAMWNEMPPPQAIPPEFPTVPQRPMPLIPPAPPADPGDPIDESGPQSRPSTHHGPTLQPANHRSVSANSRAAGSNAAWMFPAR